MLFEFTAIAALLSSALLVQASPAGFTKRDTPLAQVITSCTNPNDVALTFDDGPYTYLKDISDALTKAGAKGTFFWNGNNWRCIYDADSIDRVKYAYNAGHQVASHTWSHPHLPNLSKTQIDDEMSRIELALERILGVTPAFMRPPYGEYNNDVLEVAYTRGQKVVIWDFDSGDSTGSTADQSKALYDDTVKKHPSTILALNHEVYETTAHNVLPHAISVLQKAGYNLVTVAECMGMDPYQKVTEPQTGTWTC